MLLVVLLASAASALRLTGVRMSASAPSYSTRESGVLWDVDGTLVESTELAFVATNEVCAHACAPV